jgi:hypothetical protein
MSIDFYTAVSDGKNYISSFPRQWILDHEKDETGPKYCANCALYGNLRCSDLNENIFLGYCANCATYTYKGSRGPGFFGNFDVYDFSGESVPDYLKNDRTAIIQIYNMNKYF